VTPAQRQLEEAIRAVIAEHKDDQGRVLTDWVVIAASQGYDADDGNSTAYNYLVPDGDVPHHRLIGLLDVARARYLADFTRED
jgi:hypothetical protein